MSNEKDVQLTETRPTRTWETPELKEAGNVANVLQGGGGKLTPTSNDTGDVRKPSGQA